MKYHVYLLCIEYFAIVSYYVVGLIWTSVKANKCNKSVYPVGYGLFFQSDVANTDLNGNTSKIIRI